LYEALDKCDGFVLEILQNFLDGVVRSYWPDGMKGHLNWNDDPNRQHGDILLALDQAIAEAPNWVDYYLGH